MSFYEATNRINIIGRIKYIMISVLLCLQAIGASCYSKCETSMKASNINIKRMYSRLRNDGKIEDAGQEVQKVG